MSIEHAILGVISWYPCSGYQMKSEFETGGPAMFWEMSFGSIYPKLGQLEAEGLIEVKQAITDGRPKKIYELTGEGWQELTRWLGRPSSYPAPPHDELMLKMLFWGTSRPEDRASLVEQLRLRRAASNEKLNELKEWPQNGISAIDEYGQLLINYAIARLDAELDWLEMAIAQLEGPPRPPTQDPQQLIPQQQKRRTAALGQIQEG